jgi:hypothetical protein
MLSFISWGEFFKFWAIASVFFEAWVIRRYYLGDIKAFLSRQPKDNCVAPFMMAPGEEKAASTQRIGNTDHGATDAIDGLADSPPSIRSLAYEAIETLNFFIMGCKSRGDTPVDVRKGIHEILVRFPELSTHPARAEINQFIGEACERLTDAALTAEAVNDLWNRA